ncbi:MAG: hypothetical protein ACTSYS_16215, partial [Promethearchaeota archaeon]
EYQHGLNPQNNDTDADGMPDGWEVNNSLNPLIDDSNQDADKDGLSNLDEYRAGTDPNDEDTDDDGMLDGNDTDPLAPGQAPDSTWIIFIVIAGVAVGAVIGVVFFKKNNKRSGLPASKKSDANKEKSDEKPASDEKKK